MDDFKIQGTKGAANTGTITKTPQSKTSGASSFKEVLSRSLKEVNDLQNEAELAIRDLAQGKHGDLHRTMVLIEKADLSFRLMMRVRNKLLEAYQEIMRMPL